MDNTKKYEAWVDKVCAWIEEVGPKVNGASSAMQSPPALSGDCKVLFLGHDAHETDNYYGANRERFFKGNGTFEVAHKKWRYWARPYRSFQRIGRGDILSPGNFMLMNLFYFGGSNINSANAGMGQQVMQQCISFTEELVSDIIKPKTIVCFSVGSVFNAIRSRFTDIKRIELAERISVLQGVWNGIPVVGMHHPSAPNVSNKYLDTVFEYITKLSEC